ncbi:hypothetical protein HID58_047413, partial [Brassica napus]
VKVEISRFAIRRLFCYLLFFSTALLTFIIPPNQLASLRKGGKLIGVDMVLLDQKLLKTCLFRITYFDFHNSYTSTLIQGSIASHRLNSFENLLREGGVYELSVFDVARSNNHFNVRLVPSMVILRNLSQSRSRSLIAMFLNSTPHVRPLNKRLWNSFAKVRWLILTQPMDSAASHVLCARASCFVDSHLSAAPDAVIRKQFRVQMVVEDVTNAALFVAVDEEITKLSLGRNHS